MHTNFQIVIIYGDRIVYTTRPPLQCSQRKYFNVASVPSYTPSTHNLRDYTLLDSFSLYSSSKIRLDEFILANEQWSSHATSGGH